MVARTSIPLGPVGSATAPYTGPAILASGHRPFFLLAGVYAALALALWLLALRGVVPLAAVWHGHEMVFGFAVAAIAGFLQAAVPKWTNRPGYRGMPVAALVGLWLAGRIGMAVPGLQGLDLLFLPALAVFIGRDIVRAGNRRNYGVPLLLLGLAGLNAWYHFGQASFALRVAIFLIVTLISLIGGRIVPSFTQNALRQAGDPDFATHTPVWLDRLAVPSMLLVAITELALPASLATGLVALAAALVHGARMAGWRTWQSRRMPLVWILHAGMAFVPVGLLAKAVADLGGPVPASAALHALTAGAIGVMILAVASRAALGHAGLPLQASRATVVAYGLVIAGALLRILVPHPHAWIAAGTLWSVGYAVFSVVYLPILTRPRVDGLPG